MAPSSVNRTLWKMMIQIMNAAFATGASMFGQGVADYYIHDHFANEFYNKCKADFVEDVEEKYADPDFMPETRGRLILPRDLDFFMNTDDIKKFLVKLGQIGYSVKSKYNSVYDDHMLSGTQIKHITYTVTFNIPFILLEHVNDANKFKVDIDIIHDTDISIHNIPVKPLDMICKCLIITPDKTFNIANTLCHPNIKPLEKLKKINNIFDELTKYTTELLNPETNFTRVKNMLEKGWTLYTSNLTIIKTDSAYNKYEIEGTSDEADKCPICLDELCESVYQIKMSCCKARYDPTCLMKYMNNYNSKCPQCRAEWCIPSSEKTLFKNLANASRPPVPSRIQLPIQLPASMFFDVNS